MYTASVTRDPTAGTAPNERALSLFGIVFGVLGSGAIFFFWTMGRILLHTGNGGIITELWPQGGLWMHLFNAYPFVMVACFLVAAVLYWGLGRYKEAAGVAGLPVVGAVLYYLALVTFG